MNRITVARNGEVKLWGRPTRWLVGHNGGRWLVHPKGLLARFSTLRAIRAYLDALTDEELLA